MKNEVSGSKNWISRSSGWKFEKRKGVCGFSERVIPFWSTAIPPSWKGSKRPGIKVVARPQTALSSPLPSHLQMHIFQAVFVTGRQRREGQPGKKAEGCRDGIKAWQMRRERASPAFFIPNGRIINTVLGYCTLFPPKIIYSRLGNSRIGDGKSTERCQLLSSPSWSPLPCLPLKNRTF